MKEISLVLRDEQQLQLNHMIQETSLQLDFLINCAINEYFNNYVVWKRRFSFEPKERDRETPIPDLERALEEWR
jgi:putative salt-induced outer membrane protein YdiY